MSQRVRLKNVRACAAAAVATASVLAGGSAIAAPIGPAAFGPNAQAESFENFVPAGQGVAFVAQPATFASGVTTMNRGSSSPGVLELSASGASGCFGVSFQTSELVDGTAVICANPFVSQSGEEQGFEFILPVNAVRAGIHLASTSQAATLIVEARDANGQVIERVTKSDPAGIANFADNFIGVDAGAPIIKSIFVALDVSTGVLMDQLVFEGATDTAPTADAGADQNIRMIGDTITLNGSASFDDNTASGDLLYAWQLTGKPAASAAALTGANTAMPSFVADAAGTYTASLVVTDSIGQSSAADEVVVSTANLAPTADAGPDLVVPVGDIVVLDGSGSTDPEGMALSYAWTLGPVPDGSNATLANPNSVNPNLIPDEPGIYGATLVVSDDLGPGAPDSAEITAVARGDFASMKIAYAANLIAGLPESAVKTKGNQMALLNHLAAAATAAQRPDFDKAVEWIELALQRTDGCAANGVPDGNGLGRDWIETCAGQLEIDRSLNEALDALQ